LAGIIPVDDLRRLQKSMNRLMEDLGLSDWESKYLGEMQRIQKRMNDIMGEMEVPKVEGNIIMPMADIKETDDSIVVTMDLPGVNKDDVDISVTDNELLIVAERREEKEVSEKDYHKRERTYNRFERVVAIPVAVKADEANAKLENGVLEVTLPKEVTTTRKRISID
jgi:HSP20 family protein